MHLKIYANKNLQEKSFKKSSDEIQGIVTKHYISFFQEFAVYVVLPRRANSTDCRILNSDATPLFNGHYRYFIHRTQQSSR